MIAEKNYKWETRKQFTKTIHHQHHHYHCHKPITRPCSTVYKKYTGKLCAWLQILSYK